MEDKISYSTLDFFMNFDLIREKIKKKLKEKRLSVSEAERLSGLGPTSLRYFLAGRTKNPKLETIAAFAKVLGVDTSELIEVSDTSSNEKYALPWKAHLFIDLAKLMLNFIEKENVQIKNADAISCFLELYYLYCSREGNNLDEDFIELFLKKATKR